MPLIEQHQPKTFHFVNVNLNVRVERVPEITDDVRERAQAGEDVDLATLPSVPAWRLSILDPASGDTWFCLIDEEARDALIEQLQQTAPSGKIIVPPMVVPNGSIEH
jgi:hypothetical protein